VLGPEAFAELRGNFFHYIHSDYMEGSIHIKMRTRSGESGGVCVSTVSIVCGRQRGLPHRTRAD